MNLHTTAVTGSYVARVPMWGGIRSRIRFPPDSDLDVPTLTIEELAAGKFAALVQREAARDAFDAANLLTLMPDLTQRPMFRTAFVCFVAGSRTDPRQIQRADIVLIERTIEQDLDPLLRRDRQGIHRTLNALRDWIAQTVEPALVPLLAWSTRESQFLDTLLDGGEVVAKALLDESDVQERIRRQLMLKWKAQHVRERRGIL